MEPTNGDIRREIHRLATEVEVIKTKAEELERRLGDLDVAISEEKGEAVSYKAATQLWRSGVDNALSQDAGRRASYTALIALVVSLGSLGVAFLKYLTG